MPACAAVQPFGYDTHYYAVRLTDGSVLRLADETSNMWSSYNRVLPVLVAGCILIIILALVLAQVITKHLVQPITRMAEHLDCIEANVPYEELIPVAHQVQSERQLREDHETIRREFTDNVSHELKTPLTSISGYAELIENGMAKQEDIPTFGHRIHKEAQRMITLVSDILQLSELDGMSKQQENSPTADFVPVDLGVLVKDVATNMTVNARKAYITLQYKVQPVTVRGSHDLLTELVTNLCDNAIRYNRPGGHVELSCGTNADGARISAWRTMASASHRTARAACLSAFTEWTNPAPRRPAEQAWGSPLSSISLFCTVRALIWNPPSAPAPPSALSSRRCEVLFTGDWRPF